MEFGVRKDKAPAEWILAVARPRPHLCLGALALWTSLLPPWGRHPPPPQKTPPHQLALLDDDLAAVQLLARVKPGAGAY
jgi:hypothetical protein